MENFNIDCEKLLSDKRVIEEIHRHLWIESEKVGNNIGFERAKEDWLKKFSKAWIEYHMPEELLKAKKAANNNAKPQTNNASLFSADKTQALKSRRAKSYV